MREECIEKKFLHLIEGWWGRKGGWSKVYDRKTNSNEYNMRYDDMNGVGVRVWDLNEYKLNSTFILICKWNINKFLYIVFPFHSKLSSIIDSARVPFCLYIIKFAYLAMAEPEGSVNGLVAAFEGFAITVPSMNGAKPGRNLYGWWKRGIYFNDGPGRCEIQHDHNDFVIYYLGVSNLTDNKSLMGLARRHGAKSSSAKSPWHPVCSATRLFIERGSFCTAQGDNAEPLKRMARWIKSGRE